MIDEYLRRNIEPRVQERRMATKQSEKQESLSIPS